MTVLCVDCGNTRLKWGLHSGDRWIARGALPVAEAEAVDEALPEKPTRIVACNVAGPAVAQALVLAAGRLAAPLAWVHAHAAQCGVTSRYEHPERLGADRWAALIGARHLHGAPCVVVNAGTATTIDLLSGEGIFEGGLILPGLAMMRAALATNTAGLPHAEGVFRDLPRNTDDAIASGTVSATLGALERMYRNIGNLPGAACLLSGGAAPELTPHLSLPHRVVENLVLEGLAVYAAAQ